MTDPFVSWKLMQDQMIAAQKAQIDVATRMLGAASDFNGAMKAAQDVAAANGKAWETWMGMWGVRK